MNHTSIPGANAWPGAPVGWNPERDGECGALPVRAFPPKALQGQADLQFVESAWRPTAEEFNTLLEGGYVVLRIWGWQPPVALYVEPLPSAS